MKFGLKEKIILSIILISMLISMLLSVMFYMRSVEAIESNYTKSVTSSLTVCAGTFDDMMRDVYLTAVNASQNDTLAQLMDTTGEQSETQMLEYLESLRTGNIDSIYCFIPGRNVLLRATQTGSTRAVCSGEQLSWLRQVTQAQDNPLSPLYSLDETSVVHKRVLQYIRPVISEETQRTVGYLLFNVDERIVYFNCLQGHGHFSDGQSLLLTEDARIVSSSNLNLLGEQLPDTAKNTLRIEVTAPFSRYQMVTLVDRSVVTDDIRQEGYEILLFALVLNLLACIPVVRIVRRMMRPVQELETTMKEVGQGNLKVRANVYHADEIGRLSVGFNDMLGQIEELIEELVTQKLLKKEAEIEALQYQITPHFMYNTLNSIKYAAVLQNCDNIAQLLNAFIELLQMTASDRGSFITLEREMHMVENYAMLQRFRYADSFVVAFDVDEEVKPCYIPSLLVQPLVENAILHGIDLKKPGGRIDIRALKMGDTLAIKVEDNGNGMTTEEIQQLMSGERKSKFSGIGVRNIRERLRLYYGTCGALKFYSEKGHGASAVITVPVSYNPEEYTI